MDDVPADWRERRRLGAEFPKAMLTVRNVAAILQVPPRTVYSLVDQGFLPRRRVGSRMLRFTAEDVEELIRQSAETDR